MKKYIGVVLAAVLLFATTGCGTQKEEQKEPDTQQPAQTGEVKDTIIQAEMPQEGEEIAVMTTSEGVIKMRFFPEEAPKAVENFKTLAKDGYYDGLIFHRVIQDFMIQVGDPTGTGTGGESCGENHLQMKFLQICIFIMVLWRWQTVAPIQMAVNFLLCSKKAL